MLPWKGRDRGGVAGGGGVAEASLVRSLIAQWRQRTIVRYQHLISLSARARPHWCGNRRPADRRQEHRPFSHLPEYLNQLFSIQFHLFVNLSKVFSLFKKFTGCQEIIANHEL